MEKSIWETNKNENFQKMNFMENSKKKLLKLKSFKVDDFFQYSKLPFFIEKNCQAFQKAIMIHAFKKLLIFLVKKNRMLGLNANGIKTSPGPASQYSTSSLT